MHAVKMSLNYYTNHLEKINRAADANSDQNDLLKSAAHQALGVFTEGCIIIDKFPLTADPVRIYEFLEFFMMRIKSLRKGNCVMVPGMQSRDL